MALDLDMDAAVVTRVRVSPRQRPTRSARGLHRCWPSRAALGLRPISLWANCAAHIEASGEGGAGDGAPISIRTLLSSYSCGFLAGSVLLDQRAGCIAAGRVSRPV